MSGDEELAYLKAKTEGQQAQITVLENALAVQSAVITTQSGLIAELKLVYVTIGNDRNVVHEDELAEMKMALDKPKKGQRQKKDPKPKPKKEQTPKKESISHEENLKSLLDTKVPTLLANIPRDYKVTFGDSHPLEKPLGKYLEGFDFISLDTSEQTDGTGPVWVSLKDA